MLACKTLVQDLKTNKITVEPILGLPVLKDMIVDMEPFFINYKSVMPYFVNNSPEPSQERLQSIEEQERFDDTAKCILCGACTTSCPSFWSNDEYVGPAAIVNAHRFIFDSRDEGAAERLQILNDQFGVYRCRTIFMGLVWFGWSMLSGGEVITTAAQHIFSGDRGEVRAQSVIVALDGACGRITSSKNGR
jgi:succinate dehydrogenase / fumarate reductase iron-sulfur subunit